MRERIKESVNKVLESILFESNYRFKILNIDDVLDKVVPVFEAIYNIVPYKHIFNPRMGFHVLAFPFEMKAFSFRLDISVNEIHLSEVYKVDCIREEENKVVVSLRFFPHFGKEYNPIAVKFVPKNVKDLWVYINETYFTVPLKVEVTKYDLV